MKSICKVIATMLVFGLLTGCGTNTHDTSSGATTADSSGLTSGTDSSGPSDPSTNPEDTASTDAGSSSGGAYSADKSTSGRSSSTQSANTKTTTATTNAQGDPNYDPNHKVTMTLEPVQLHPGVAGMDASYSFSCFEKSSGKIINAAFITLKTSESTVYVDDLTITVPYAVRQNKDYIDLTVFSRDNPDQVGRYRLKFDWKYTAKTTFADEFDKIDERIWNDPWGTVGNLSKLVKDGKAAFNVVPKNGSYVGEGINSNFAQEYGCFSASIDYPLMGGDYILAAWWLKSPDGIVYSANPDDPTSVMGEFDIVEWNPVGGYPFCTFHYNGWKPGQTISSASTFINNKNFLNGFHTYSGVWSDKGIWWYYDGKLVKTIDDPAFMGKNKMHLLLQMGLIKPNNVQASDLPVEMLVDWVKVHQFTKKP